MTDLEPFDWHTQGEIRPLPSRVLVHNMEHGERRTKAGIIIGDDDGKDRGVRPRWATVYSVGSEVSDVKKGDRVLISHGRWSRGVSVSHPNGEITVVRMVEPESILLVEDC
jgi:co-chaperonin GroES (HSP10)